MLKWFVFAGNEMAVKIGVVDTTFARVDLGAIACSAIAASGEDVRVVRVTVPGVKDLPVACKKLIDEESCASIVALGMPGPKPIDKMCAHEASLGIIHAQLLANKHILEVFVHEDEAESSRELVEICRDRVKKHSLHAVKLALGESLSKNAGLGLRQGKEDAGPVAEGFGLASGGASGFSH